MTTSDLTSKPPTAVFVWMWLPQANQAMAYGRSGERVARIAPLVEGAAVYPTVFER
jgi:hypothetical protein